MSDLNICIYVFLLVSELTDLRASRQCMSGLRAPEVRITLYYGLINTRSKTILQPVRWHLKYHWCLGITFFHCYTTEKRQVLHSFISPKREHINKLCKPPLKFYSRVLDSCINCSTCYTFITFPWGYSCRQFSSAALIMATWAGSQTCGKHFPAAIMLVDIITESRFS